MSGEIFYVDVIETTFKELRGLGLVEEKEKSTFIEISKVFQSLYIDNQQIENIYKVKLTGRPLILQPVGPTSQIPLTELLQHKLDHSVKLICDKIETLISHASPENAESLKILLQHYKKLLKDFQDSISDLESAYQHALQGAKPLKASQDAQEFTNHIANYAQERRHLSNVMKLQCDAYQGKVVKNALQSPAEVKKEMAKTFFNTLVEKGYDLEQSHVTIGNDRFDLSKVYESKADRDDLIAKAKTNATNLREKSFVNQASFYFDTPERQQAFKKVLQAAKEKQVPQATASAGAAPADNSPKGPPQSN